MSKYSVPASVAVSDSGFLFLSSTGETFTMNEIGREVFKLLQAGDGTEVIAKTILAAYDIDGASFERDLDDFLHQLKSFNLVTPA